MASELPLIRQHLSHHGDADADREGIHPVHHLLVCPCPWHEPVGDGYHSQLGPGVNPVPTAVLDGHLQLQRQSAGMLTPVPVWEAPMWLEQRQERSAVVELAVPVEPLLITVNAHGQFGRIAGLWKPQAFCEAPSDHPRQTRPRSECDLTRQSAAVSMQCLNLWGQLIERCAEPVFYGMRCAACVHVRALGASSA